MSQTNSNTNTGAGNTNRNQITEGDEQGQGDPSGRGRGGYRGNYRNNSIAIYLFEGRMKDGSFPNLLLPKPGIEPLNTRRLLILYPLLCIDKNFRYIDDVLCMWTNLKKKYVLTSLSKLRPMIKYLQCRN